MSLNISIFFFFAETLVEIPSAIETSKAKDHAVPDNKNEEKVISIPSSFCLQDLFAQTTVVRTTHSPAH